MLYDFWIPYRVSPHSEDPPKVTPSYIFAVGLHVKDSDSGLHKDQPLIISTISDLLYVEFEIIFPVKENPNFHSPIKLI